MISEDIFDAEYGGDKTETLRPKTKKSATKEFLSQAIATEDLRRYGMAKPTRVVVKANLINEEG